MDHIKSDEPPVFEKVFCINLRRRPDRWRQFITNIESIGAWYLPQVQYFEATDGWQQDTPSWWNAGGGAYGCFDSHRRILQSCVSSSTNSVLILEDDAYFLPHFNERLSQFLQSVPDDWEQLYLGGQHQHEHRRKPVLIAPGVVRPYNVNRTHAYALRGSGITKVLSYLEDFEQWSKHPTEHIDHRLGRLHEQGKVKVYCPDTWLVGQAANRSDIDGRTHNNRLWNTYQIIEQRAAPLPPVPAHEDKVRVGIYVPSVRVGGVEIWLRTLFSFLDPSRFIVSGVGVDQTMSGPQLPLPWPITKDINSLAANSDVIVVWGVNSLKKVKKRFKGPIVHVSHDCWPGWSQKQLAKIAGDATHWVAVSESCRNEFAEPHRSMCQVIHNGIVETSPPDRERTREKLGIGDRLAVGFIGRFCEEKDPLSAARAVASLPDAVCVMHGYQFDQKQDWVQEARNLIDNDRLIVRGPEDDVNETWAALDCFIHSPRVEPFGLTYLEAWQAKVPVVSSNTGIVKECGENVAVIVPSEADGEILAQAVSEAGKREKVDRAYQMFKERFTRWEMSQKWQALLWEAVRGRSIGEIKHKDIPGMFNFQTPYRRVAEAMKDGAVCVEVGCYLGQSTSYLAIEGLNLHRSFQLWAVDTWKGTPGEHEEMDYMPSFIANMQRGYNLLGTVKPLRMESTQAARLFRDQSVDFIYLDGDHSYEAVRDDIAAWLPKCRGVIAGHDYEERFPGVIQAVTERFGEVQVDPVSHTWAVLVGRPSTFLSDSFMRWDRSIRTGTRKRVYKAGEKRPQKIPRQLLAI